MAGYVEQCPKCGRQVEEFFSNSERPTILYCKYDGLIPITDEAGFEEAKRVFWRGLGEGRFRNKARQMLRKIGYNRKGQRGYEDWQIDMIFDYWGYELKHYRKTVEPEKGKLALPAPSPLNDIILQARDLFYRGKRKEAAKLLLLNGFESREIQNGNDGFFDVWYKEMGDVRTKKELWPIKLIPHEKIKPENLPMVRPKQLEYHQSGYLFVRTWADEVDGSEISATFWCSKLSRERLTTPIMDLECRPGIYTYYAVAGGKRKDGRFEIKPGQTTRIDIAFGLEGPVQPEPGEPEPTPEPTPTPTPPIHPRPIREPSKLRVWGPLKIDNKFNTPKFLAPSLIILLGIIFAVILRNMWLFFASVSWGIYSALPTPESTFQAQTDRIRKNVENKYSRIIKALESERINKLSNIDDRINNARRGLAGARNRTERDFYRGELDFWMNEKRELNEEYSARKTSIEARMQKEIDRQTNIKTQLILAGVVRGWATGFASTKGIFKLVAATFLTIAFLTSPIPLAKPAGLVLAFVIYFAIGQNPVEEKKEEKK